MTNNVFKRTTLALGLALMLPLAAWSQVSLSVSIAPPPLPLYAQPPIPGDGYIWTPGYWAWDPTNGDYTWVPGTWVLPPSVGVLWTPGYWAFGGGAYLWHRGYWGSHVGYYGGLNYGYGYNGNGYWGGRWDGGHFRYNSAVNNLPAGRVHNVYRAPGSAHASRALPARARELQRRRVRTSMAPHRRPNAAVPARGQHGAPTNEQAQHEQRAMGMPEQRMDNNHGAPPTAATPRPGGFGEPGVERGRTCNGNARAPADACCGTADACGTGDARGTRGARP